MKQVKVQNLIELIDEIMPFSLAESWDNSGLQAGDLNWGVKKILIALDVSMGAMEDAVKWGADLLLTHHPLMIQPCTSIDFATMPGNIIKLAAEHKISIVSAHTNLDKAEGGLNDYFASVLKLRQIDSLFPYAAELTNKLLSKKEQTVQGLGRTGLLDTPLSLNMFAKQVKTRLGLSSIRVVGDDDLQINKVAICTGSGGSLLEYFYRTDAEVYVTGDVKYHEARDVEAAGLGLIDVGHFASEHIVIELLKKVLGMNVKKYAFDVEIRGYEKESDPFKTI